MLSLSFTNTLLSVLAMVPACCLVLIVSIYRELV